MGRGRKQGKYILSVIVIGRDDYSHRSKNSTAGISDKQKWKVENGNITGNCTQV